MSFLSEKILSVLANWHVALSGRLVVKQREIRQTAFMAADWLLRIQEPNGNFVAVINPLMSVVRRIDWSRSGLTSRGLVEFGKITGNPDYIEAGKKNFFYIKKYLLEESAIFDKTDRSAIALAFLGELALSLGFEKNAQQCVSELSRKEILKLPPISSLQVGIFFARFPGGDKKNFELILKIADTAMEKFGKNLQNKIPMSLPAWAGLMELNFQIYEMTGNFSYLQAAKKTADWLLSNQLNSGSFRSTTDSDFAYTRGTSKVCEILACVFAAKNDKKIDNILDVAYYKKRLNNAFNWLGEMQYSSGGFRHDYFNPDLWIDSVGHLLLAASRFLKGDK